MKLNFKILGMPELQTAIDETTKELKEAEDPATMAAGEPIRDTWKSLVPVLDGNYRDALQVAHVPGKGAVVGTAWLGRVGRDDQPFLYARRLEFGDSKIPAEPSARPAIAASRQAAIDAGAEPFRSVIRGRKARVPRR